MTITIGVRWAITLLCVVIATSHGMAEKPSDPAPATVSSPSKDPSADNIRRWINDLSHDAYSVRQEAAAQLLTAGMAARQPLLELADGPDPETRAAARRIVALIDRSEFRRRLEAFAADTDGRQGLTLPGWDQFQKIVGGDPAARALFVDMQRQEGALISSVFGVSKRPPEELWESRLLRIARWQNPYGQQGAVPPLGSCATMLFLGSLPEMNVTDAAASFVQSIIQRSPVKDLLQPDSSQPAVRKLVVTWLLACPNKSEEVLRQRLNVVSTTRLTEALPLALQVATGEPQFLRVTPLTKAVATLIVGQLGSRADVERLEPLLEDSTVCLPLQVQAPGQPATSVQVRDVALVVLLHLTDQDPPDYGYTKAIMGSPRTFQLQNLYCENDQQRSAAIAKWRAWRTAHKDEFKSVKPAKSNDTSAKK